MYKAKETLSVYAPLANRLGIWRLKNELESLSLEVLEPEAHTIIKNRLTQIHEEQQEEYQLISGQIFDCLLQANLDVRRVFWPQKTFTAFTRIYAKMGPRFMMWIKQCGWWCC